jgi:ribonuclease BN (tRNA processing enzyme)
MELIVLGASAAYPRFGKACSGYLIREGKINILIDCGTGVLSNLFQWTDPVCLNAIVITHLHTDHFLDIYPLRYYLQYDRKTDSPLLVLAPPSAEEHILKLVSGESREQFTNIFRFMPIDQMSRTNIGPLSLNFFMVPHFAETFGVGVANEKRIVFSSDCGFESKSVLKKVAFGADLLVCEATLQEKIVSLEKGHLTAEQAGEIAAEAKVEKLMLTHIWSSLNPEVSKNLAEKVFGGEVILATENQKLEI